MIIDPQGLFEGERLRQCSDMARLMFPYLFLASNTVGRIELDYAKLRSRIFLDFDNPPSREEFLRYIREYHENHLLFTYRFGQKWWGQWDTKRENLPRWKKKTDESSPAPETGQFHAWKQEYRQAVDDKELQNSAQKCEELRRTSHRVGIGIGVGVGIGNTTTVSAKNAETVVESASDSTPRALFPDDIRPRKKRQPAPGQEKLTAVATAVYEHYCAVMGKNPAIYKLTRGRRTMLSLRAREMYETARKTRPDLDEEGLYTLAAALMRACVDKLRQSPFHMGENDRGVAYNDLRHVFRSAEKLEWWIEKP